MRRVTGLDWPLLALGGCLLVLSAAGAIAVTHFDDPKVGVVLLLQCVPYAIAAWLVLRGRPDDAGSGRALATILLVGVAMRCLLLPGTPVSTDLFRYVWDGRVQAAGINPYLYVPNDAALSSLRDGTIYPFINRADYAPTMYPPASQVVFYLITRISEAPIAMRAAMVAFEGLAVPILAGVALGACALVKYFPVVTGPALYKRWDWRLPLAFIATAAALYLPYIGAGTKVFGYLGGYISEEGLDRGSGIFWWQLIGAFVSLPQWTFSFYLAAAALLMAVLALVIVFRPQRPDADLAGAMLLAVAFTLLLAPHYAWYFAWLVPFLCFYPVVGVIYLTCAVSLLYFAHWPPTLSEALPIYVPCVLILVAEFAWRRRRRKAEEPHADAALA